jgi:hypothetical protein
MSYYQKVQDDYDGFDDQDIDSESDYDFED